MKLHALLFSVLTKHLFVMLALALKCTHARARIHIRTLTLTRTCSPSCARVQIHDDVTQVDLSRFGAADPSSA